MSAAVITAFDKQSNDSTASERDVIERPRDLKLANRIDAVRDRRRTAHLAVGQNRDLFRQTDNQIARAG